jgi:glycosyltransferase involved in cell wall biosynthesis
MPARDNDAPLLLDASRLVWRRWSGTRATGIDRICLAWMEHYGPRAQAVIVHRQGQAILPFSTSQALFRLLTQPERGRGRAVAFRAALASLAIRRSGHLRDRLDGRGRFWLNPGHTGLDREGLSEWTRRRELRPVHLVHDLIPITHPQFCRQGEAERHARRMATVLESAAGVVANSAHTLATFAEFAAARGRAVPPAAVAWPGTPVLPRVPVPAASEPTFVILGTIEGRKNHALLLALWRRMLAAGGGNFVPRLVIVGRRGWQAEDVFAELEGGVFGDRVSEVGALDDRRLAEALAGAWALLFPSFAEGYGIPLVEALAAGVPVIASDLPVFREIGQGVPELIAPGDAAAWEAAIADYARPDSPRRAAQLARLAQFAAPDWRGHFARVDALLASLAA